MATGRPLSCSTVNDTKSWIDMIICCSVVAESKYAILQRTKNESANGHIHLPVSTINHTYEFSEVTHVTPLHRYRKHSTGPNTHQSIVPTYRKFGSSPFLQFKIKVPSRMLSTPTEGCRVGHLHRAWILRYHVLYLRTCEYRQYLQFFTSMGKHHPWQFPRKYRISRLKESECASILAGVGGVGGGYSLYEGYYICSSISTPLL